MDGEQKFIVLMVSLALICTTIFGAILPVVLWQYRVGVALGVATAIGVVLLANLALGIIHSVNENYLRHKRVRYHEELPTDEEGIPYYIPKDTQVYPQHTRAYYQSYEYSPYQSQQRERF